MSTHPQTAPSEADERELVRALQGGDGQAYERLVREHTGRMLAVARRDLRHEEDAREAVQEAFVSAFRAIDRFEGEARLSTWLHRITVNACLRKLRRRRRKPEESIDDLLPGFLEDGHMADTPAPWRDSADRLLEREESRVRVREAIAKLPDNYRTVLLLRDIEGRDTDETARELDLTPGTVKTRLHRARLALRTLLDTEFREEAS